MRCATKAVVFRAFSFSGTRFNMSTTAALPSRSNPLPLHPRAQHVMDYWFAKGWESADPGDTRQQCVRMWFGGGPDIDKEITDNFGKDCEALLRGEYDDWQDASAHQALAAIILGDQFCRNVYRGTAKMYEADPKVLLAAKNMVANATYKQLLPVMRTFVFLPYMHSEELADQDECVKLYQELQIDAQSMENGEELAKFAAMSVDYAERHRRIVAKYGRFPHRNKILGRDNTAEEAQGLEDGSIEGF